MSIFAGAGALGGLLGGGLNAGMSYLMAKDAREAQREAYQNRYQWMMKDMRKAGLNPILAYKTSPGNVGQMAAATVPSFVGAMSEGANAVTRARQANMAIAQGAKEIEVRDKDIALKDRQIDLVGQQFHNERTKAAFYQNQAMLMGYQAQIAGLDVPRAVREADFWSSEAGKYQPYLDRSVSSAISAAKNVGTGLYGASRNFLRGALKYAAPR